MEDNGFMIADFTADEVVMRLFEWDSRTQPASAIDTLQPSTTLKFPSG